jgi:hypothetical protein
MAASDGDRGSDPGSTNPADPDPVIEDDLQELPPNLHEQLIAAVADKLGLPVIDVQIQTTEGKPIGQIARERVGIVPDVEDLLHEVEAEVLAYATETGEAGFESEQWARRHLEQLLFQPVDWVD